MWQFCSIMKILDLFFDWQKAKKLLFVMHLCCFVRLFEGFETMIFFKTHISLCVWCNGPNLKRVRILKCKCIENESTVWSKSWVSCKAYSSNIWLRWLGACGKECKLKKKMFIDSVLVSGRAHLFWHRIRWIVPIILWDPKKERLSIFVSVRKLFVKISSSARNLVSCLRRF